jgi:uncharacterized protein (DUF1330 family)
LELVRWRFRVFTLKASHRSTLLERNDVSNSDAYAKEFLPLIKESIKASGGRYVAAGKATTLEGEPPASRVVVIAFDSLEKIQAWRDSQAFKDDRKIGDKYAKFRAYAIDGIPQ